MVKNNIFKDFISNSSTFFANTSFSSTCLRFLEEVKLTVQAERDVDGADVGDVLEVHYAGALEVRGGGRVAHVDPADRLLGVDEVHGHGLLGGDGRQPGAGAGQRRTADVVEVGDEQHGQTVHRL